MICDLSLLKFVSMNTKWTYNDLIHASFEWTYRSIPGENVGALRLRWVGDCGGALPDLANRRADR